GDRVVRGHGRWVGAAGPAPGTSSWGCLACSAAPPRRRHSVTGTIASNDRAGLVPAPRATFPRNRHARRRFSPRSCPRPVVEFGPNRMNSQGGIVQPKSTFFSRFFVKFLEVVGAGLASAVCAYVLGQAGALHPPPAPAVLPP